ncbi:MAG: cupin domain-containing protein [Anaerolineae bacterium]|nr:cupin domain-containing protein [Anaerolineae bacterium]
MAVMTSYQQIAAFRPDRFNPVVLAENERVKAILACFEPGQFIPVHKPGVDLTLIVMEGEGTAFIGAKEEKLRPGVIAFIPAGEARGVKATTRLVLMHVVTPPPTEADHTQVVAGLKKGAWM